MKRLFDALRERLLLAGVAPRHVRRYLAELADHVADLRAEEERAGRDGAQAEAAALARLGGIDALARAMTERRQLRSWCARAPWAMFGVAPLLLLAGAYLVACLILWSGWRILLPESVTPFVPTGGFAVYYFGVGRALYFTAPLLVGWALALLAARQRLGAGWPAAGMALMAVAGEMAHVQTFHAAGAGPGGRVSMFFSLDPSVQELYQGLLRVGAFLMFTLLPYLLWRRQRSRARSA